MKRGIIGLLAALVVGWLGWLPFPRTDAGELFVVETLLLEADGETVTLHAGEVTGTGATLDMALEDLASQAPGELFLRQTRRMIFCGGAQQQLDPLRLPEELPMGAAVYGTETPAEELTEKTKKINDILEAQERREKNMPTLARLKNSALARETPELAAISWEEPHETT